MTTRASAPVGAPCWIDLMTSDVAGSRSFYGELFGWTSSEPDEAHGGYVNFSKDGRLVAGGMATQPGVPTPDLWSVYLASEDAKETVDAVVANGGSVVVAPMDVTDLGTMAVVTDVGGAGIGVWQPGEHTGFGVLGEPGAPAWFELHTRDYDASVAFYEAAFRWDAHTVSDSPAFRYTTLGEGEGQLAGIMDATAHLPEGTPAHWAVYFNVEDTDAALATVVELGGTVVVPAADTPYGRLAVAADPTGAAFRLQS